MLPSLEKGGFPPSPRRKHPAREAVIALVLTNLVNILEKPQQGEPLDKTYHHSQSINIELTAETTRNSEEILI